MVEGAGANVRRMGALMSNDVMVSETTVPVDGGAVPVTVATGEAGGPALVIVPSVFGITPGLVEQMKDFAKSASVVIAMDLFWRTGGGALAFDDMPTVMQRLKVLDRDKAYEDFCAVARAAKDDERANGHVIGLGICFGGPFCFVGAADGLLDGVVTWHGSWLQNYIDRASEMRCPMELHFGEVDRVVPLDAVEAVRAAFAGRDDVDIVVHEAADHGFSQPGARTYVAAASAAGMKSVHARLAASR